MNNNSIVLTPTQDEMAATLTKILNLLFSDSPTFKIESLDPLSDDIFYYSLLKKIEPNLSFTIIEGNSFEQKKINFETILVEMTKYIKANPKVSKPSLTTKSDLKSSVSTKSILNNESDALIFLAQILLFITTISSICDYYKEKIADLDTPSLSAFCTAVEKFTSLDKIEKSVIASSIIYSSLTPSIIMKNENEIEQQNKLQENQLEKENESLKERISELEKEKADIEMALMNKSQECNFLQGLHNKNIDNSEELSKVSIKNAELISTLSGKEIEFNSYKREAEKKINELSQEKINLNEENSILKEKLSDYNSIKAQYEKLNEKYKKVLVSGESSNMNDLMNSIDLKEKQIESFTKERNYYVEQIEKLGKEKMEIIEERDKLKDDLIQLRKLSTVTKKEEPKAKDEISEDMTFHEKRENIENLANMFSKERIEEILRESEKNKKKYEIKLEEWKKMKTELEKMKIDYQAVAEKNALIESMKKQISDLKKEKEESEAAFDKEKNEKLKLKDDIISKMSGELDAIKHKYQELEKEQESKEKLISELRTESEELKKAADTTKDSNRAETDKIIQAHTEEINKYKLQIESLTKNDQDELAKLNAQIEKLTQTNVANSAQITELKSQYDAMKENFSVKEAEVVQLTQDLTNANKILAEKESKISSLLEQLTSSNSASSEKEILLKEINELKQVNNTLDMTTKNLEKEISILTAEKERISQENKENLSMKNLLSEENKSQAQIFKEMNAKISSLTAIVNSKDKEINQLKENFSSQPIPDSILTESLYTLSLSLLSSTR